MAATSQVAASARCFLPHAGCSAGSSQNFPRTLPLIPLHLRKAPRLPRPFAARPARMNGVRASGVEYSGNSIVWPTAELQLPYASETEQQERPPGLVDLDPQNMLLRQRIVFLGGQVSVWLFLTFLWRFFLLLYLSYTYSCADHLLHEKMNIQILFLSRPLDESSHSRNAAPVESGFWRASSLSFVRNLRSS